MIYYPLWESRQKTDEGLAYSFNEFNKELEIKEV
jgi:hypothetical protein